MNFHSCTFMLGIKKTYTTRPFIGRNLFILTRHRGEREKRASANIHSIAKEGFGESNASLYSKSRPTYSKDVIDRVVTEILLNKPLSEISVDAATTIKTAAASISPPRRQKLKILEIGAGTGKFTESFFVDAYSNNIISRDTCNNNVRNTNYGEELRQIVQPKITERWLKRRVQDFDRADEIKAELKEKHDVNINDKYGYWTARIKETGETVCDYTDTRQGILNPKTGKPTDYGIEYIATDPSVPFLKELKIALDDKISSLQNHHRVKLDIKEGTGSQTPISDMENHSVDAVIAAQCFHWMASEKETLREIHRVLKPKAPFIMVWNYFDTKSPWMNEIENNIIDSVYKKIENEAGDGKLTPRYVTSEWKKAFTPTSIEKLFKLPVASHHGEMPWPSDAASIVERVLSISVMHSLSAEQQQEIGRRVLQVLADNAAVAEKRADETFLYPLVYATEVAVVRTKAPKAKAKAI